MKTTTIEPTNAAYLGSEQPDGSITEQLSDFIDDAIAPLIYIDSEGQKHYFDEVN